MSNDTTVARSNTPLYWVYKAIIKRCTNPRDKSYYRYGARGISVCAEWIDSFQAFYNHVAHLPDFEKDGYSLDRIDNSLGYAPGNVRWASIITQARNSRNAHEITYNGKTQCLTAWAEETGISFAALSQRITSMGWDIERALTTPVKQRLKPSSETYPRQKH